MSFHDEAISQPYLSLGLTPLSQLSPPDDQDVGFFPGLPPPIATSTSDHGSYSIPVDGPMFIDDGKKSLRRKRRGSLLEPVPEQPSSTTPSDCTSRYSQGSHGLSPTQKSVTSMHDEFIFPSASISQDYLGNKMNRPISPNYGAQNSGYSSHLDDDPLIDFNEYGSGYSIHVDSSPDHINDSSTRLAHNTKAQRRRSSNNSRGSQSDSKFSRAEAGRQNVKRPRSKGDLSSQRQSWQPRKDDEGVDRPVSPYGVYPVLYNNNYTPPERDEARAQFFGSMNSISSLKEDHVVTSL